MAKLFVSYRREDTGAIVGRIVDRLSSHFGRASLFLDIDSIPYGVDFRSHMLQILSSCHVVLAVIGVRWAGNDLSGIPRLLAWQDPVRMELAAALRLELPLIPILVNGVPMPATDTLPPDIQAVSYLNAATLDQGRDFHSHMDRLVQAINEFLKGSGDADITGDLFSIVHSTHNETGELPIVEFTVANRSGVSQIITRLECDILGYDPYLSIPASRVLRSVATWDIVLPFEEGKCQFSPTEPILVANGDAVTIGLRFLCGIARSVLFFRKRAISPKGIARYTCRVRFISDQGYRATSQIFVI